MFTDPTFLKSSLFTFSSRRHLWGRRNASPQGTILATDQKGSTASTPVLTFSCNMRIMSDNMHVYSFTNLRKWSRHSNPQHRELWLILISQFPRVFHLLGAIYVRLHISWVHILKPLSTLGGGLTSLWRNESIPSNTLHLCDRFLLIHLPSGIVHKVVC